VSEYLANPRPRALTGKGWGIVGAILLVVVVLYALAIAFYQSEGGMKVDGGLGATADTGLIVTLEPRIVEAKTDTASIHLSMDDAGAALIDEDGFLTTGLRLSIVGADGAADVRIPAGELLGEGDAVIALDGDVSSYPFDVHSGTLYLSAETYTQSSDGSIKAGERVPIALQAEGGVSGWNSVADLPTGFDQSAAATFTFSRAFSTQVFAVLLVTLFVVVALSALVVSVLVVSNRRRIEVTLLSWCAALLFALPVLRNNLPNAPPIGATIDIFVFLWAIVMTAVALVLLVIGWIRQKRAELEAEQASGPVTP
jgi:hypothetical protein